MLQRLLLAVLVLSFFPGCVADARIKRQSSLNSVKVETAAAEFKAAETDKAKVEVASEYFTTAPKQIRIVDDYLHGRQPEPIKAEVVPLPPQTISAPVKPD